MFRTSTRSTRRERGRIDLVVTNKVTGQVSVLINQGDHSFAPQVPYRAGTGLSWIDTTAGTPKLEDLDATVAVAAGAFTTGAPADLVTVNAGSSTIDLLAGLGEGRFANPVSISTDEFAPQIIRVADFNADGIPDLAVLSSEGVNIYLCNGHGGFAPPALYNAGTGPSGLSVADLNGDGQIDLLIGNAAGDVLILVDAGDGTFRPFEPVKAAIALAVADLNGNGVPDFVFADQSLDQVTVEYGTTSETSSTTRVIANQSSGLLAPGAVKLADLNGDNISDLIIADSGANRVLVYPGLPNGQFGPPVGGTSGFAVGTDPTGLTVYNLNGQPDLLVADTGSNDISVLLGHGTGTSWTLISGPRIKTDAGPVATVVGSLLGPNESDLAVANSGADNVQIFPGVGGGFFNDQPQATRAVPVGQGPQALFLGNFNGLGLGVATLNAGSDNGSLISLPGSANPLVQNFATGGNSPTTGFAGDFGDDGLTDLVVGNNADGHLALLLGGNNGLSLSQTFSSAIAPNPTAVSFGGFADNVLSFYVSTAGREAAFEMAFNLEADATTIGPASAPTLGPSSAPGVAIVQVSQLGGSSGSVLDLIANLVTLTVLPESLESELESTSGGTTLLSAFSPGGPTGSGQGLSPSSSKNDDVTGEAELKDEEITTEPGAAGQVNAPVDRLAPWARFVVGLDEAWRELRDRLVERERAMPLPVSIVRDEGTSGEARVRPRVPSSPTREHNPSRSQSNTRSGSREGTGSQVPSRTGKPNGAPANGTSRTAPTAAKTNVVHSTSNHILSAIDQVIADLDESLPRQQPFASNRTDSASRPRQGKRAHTPGRRVNRRCR